jgi:hypothetical protein
LITLALSRGSDNALMQLSASLWLLVTWQPGIDLAALVGRLVAKDRHHARRSGHLEGHEKGLFLPVSIQVHEMSARPLTLLHELAAT